MTENKTSEWKDAEVEIEYVRPRSQIGLFGAVAFGMGSMIGSGIFISPKGALQNAGSPGMSLVMWALCGILSLLMGLVYGELGTLVPLSGGDYTYIRKGLGSVPAFLAVWIYTLFGSTGSMAVLSLVFADYLLALLFGSCQPPDIMRQIIAALMIITLCITNVISVTFGAYTQIICTVAKTLALIVISIGGIVFLCEGSVENLQNMFKDSSTDVTGYSLAIYSCMFAYHGYSRIGEIAEELENPKQNIPRAVIISVIIVTMVYVITNLSYFVLLPKDEFLHSSAVAYDWGLKGIAPVAFLIPLSVMCSVYGASNGNGFSTGRVMFSAARAGHFPEVMSFLHVQTSVPVVSIVVMHAISLIMLAAGDISVLINFLSFVTFIVVLMTTMALLRLRYEMHKNKVQHDGFKTPIIIPIVTALICIFMIVSPLVNNPRIEFLYGSGIVIFGLIIYVPLVHFQLSVPGVGSCTTFLQLLCNVSPTQKVD
ncbi:b(0,+)-type amino acid transporter 1-like [Mercenaria mercenaria]|uniref:b(0,+)-type amino acid transporter 1-like n=1 Tax=Mercenaria mercenaria TaxID=6596 RepID=UPI00234E6876|nr:b(0,+)-type amino acid transporter 1-like [Mercenaria mercenaria]